MKPINSIHSMTIIINLFNIAAIGLLVYLYLSYNLGFNKALCLNILFICTVIGLLIRSFIYLHYLEHPLYVQDISTLGIIRYTIFILVVSIGLSYYLNIYKTILIKLCLYSHL